MTETVARAREQARPRTRGRVSKFLIPEVIFGGGTLAEVGGVVRRVGGARHVMRFNAETHPKRYVDVARALGVDVDGLTAIAAAEAAVGRVESLAATLGVPGGLRDVGVQPGDFDRFARTALRDAYIATNPRPVTEDDVRRICVAAY